MPALTIVEFGDALLRTGDLDPVYGAIAACGLDGPTLHRLCLAYWCLYHLGAAAKIAEETNPRKFWALMRAAAVNEGYSQTTGKRPWPRGAERRHFRGDIATQAVAYLENNYKTATDAVYGMADVPLKRGQSAVPFYAVTAKVQSHPGFGPWMGFKIADMAERVLGGLVDFEDCQLSLYRDPRQGAALAYYLDEIKPMADQLRLPQPYAGREWEYPTSDDTVRETVDRYIALWRKKKSKAPPKHDRLVNVQEIETIFCKFKSHYKGHYPVGKDTREIGHALESWGDLAQQLKRGLDSCTRL